MGQINECKIGVFQAGGATSYAFNDAGYEFLVAKGVSPGHINDMWMTYLTSQGYTGALSDMMHAYWVDQACLGDEVATKYFLTLTGTQYIEKLEPVTHTDDFYIEIVFETSTTNLHQCLWSNSNSSASRSYIDTAGKIVTAYAGGANIYTPSVDLRDGQQHTLRYEVDASADTITYDIDDGASVGTKAFTFTDTTIDTIGRRGDNNSLHFNGTIFSVEEGGASASTLTWNFDSGPPNYEVGEDQSFAYEHWYEPTNVTINTTTGDVEFSGLQGNYSSVLLRHVSGTNWIADADRYAVSFEVVAEAGTVQVKVGGDGSGYKTTGVYTEVLVADGSTATVIQSNGGGSLFKGSVINLSIEPYIATISDGLVYEESEEHPLGADIGSEVTVPASGNVDMPGMVSGAAYYIEPAVSSSLTITTANGAGKDFANGLAFINAASTNLNIANSSGSPITFTPVVKPADNVAIYHNVLNPDWTPLAIGVVVYFADFSDSANAFLMGVL